MRDQRRSHKTQTIKINYYKLIHAFTKYKNLIISVFYQNNNNHWVGIRFRKIIDTERCQLILYIIILNLHSKLDRRILITFIML